ncbi:F-box-like domain-containing protein [Rhizoctonia solani AG-1 IA]|uniref:F-box-like domain-containing protein n=1 Tax=Thanatephorus cucumeris (strain AG1-IA) TaxID=983506 RepID=L8WXZ3_THACA|nr:F-box-like domain-containing protein [Rhizoctonia solani AG-1 IA]
MGGLCVVATCHSRRWHSDIPSAHNYRLTASATPLFRSIRSTFKRLDHAPSGLPRIYPSQWLSPIARSQKNARLVRFRAQAAYRSSCCPCSIIAHSPHEVDLLLCGVLDYSIKLVRPTKSFPPLPSGVQPSFRHLEPLHLISTKSLIRHFTLTQYCIGHLSGSGVSSSPLHGKILRLNAGKLASQLSRTKTQHLPQPSHHLGRCTNSVDYRLPTETLHRIFRSVDPSGLAAICLASHRTRAIAEPILYTSPQADSPARVLLLVRTLSTCSDLAQCVRSLLLGLDGPDAEEGLGTRYLPSLLRKLKLLFESGKLQKLNELVWCARGETGWALPDSVNSLPRLTRFSTTASSASLVSFLTTHPSISHLTLHSHGLALRLPANALPRLTHLACAAPALSSLPVRKLKHVILTDAPFIPLLGDKVLSALGGDQSHREFGRGWRDASPAPDHIESLRSVTLRLGHVIISPTQAPLILEPFARHVPALKKLGIVAGPSGFGILDPGARGVYRVENHSYGVQC